MGREHHSLVDHRHMKHLTKSNEYELLGYKGSQTLKVGNKFPRLLEAVLYRHYNSC